MNGKWKIISGVVLTIFALLSAGWGLNKQFVPREVHDLKYEDVREDVAGLSKEVQISQWLNQRFYWQQKVDEYTNDCIAQPTAENRRKLDNAKRKRDEADREIRKLQAR